jgi:hypothetical protein
MSKLSIQIISDTHVEFWDKKDKFNFVRPSAPILVLSGDIGCCALESDFERYKKFINELLQHYQHIIIIAGNHEYYYNGTGAPNLSHTMQAVEKKINDFCHTSRKLHYLNNRTLKLIHNNTSYYFVGTTLWTWIPEDIRDKISNNMNDYSHIYVADKGKPRLITPTDVANLHVKSVRYIRSQVSKARKNKYNLVVLTHHKPYISSARRPLYLNCAYESDLSALIQPPVTLWGYGHTHIHDNSTLNQVHIYSNPRGYPYEKNNYVVGESIQL